MNASGGWCLTRAIRHMYIEVSEGAIRAFGGERAPRPRGEARKGSVMLGKRVRLDARRRSTMPVVDRGAVALGRQNHFYGGVAVGVVLFLLGVGTGGVAEARAVSAPAGRAYEMVTPADKAQRRGGTVGLDLVANNPGVLSPDASGDTLLTQLFSGTMSDPAFALPNDYMVSRRTDNGWLTESLETAAVHGVAQAGNFLPTAANGDFSVSTWSSTRPLVTTANPVGSPPPALTAGYDYTRFPDSRGWELFVSDPALQPNDVASARFSADNNWIVRYGSIRGLLGVGDPTLAVTSGKNVYAQDLRTGALTAVSGCTGSGAAATSIPERLATGKLGAQSCVSGSPVSTRGAVLGAGDQNYGIAAPLAGSSARAMSADANRIVFASPDPSVTGTGQTSCGTGTGTATACPSQLYLRQTDDSGVATVRWISRSKVSNQDVGLIGRGVAFEGASSDGRVVYFRTNAPLTADDPNGTGAVVSGGVVTGSASANSWDLYRYDVPDGVGSDPGQGTLTRITAGPTGSADPNTSCSSVAGVNCSANAAGGAARFISDDGSRVYFVTAAPIPGVPTNTAPTNGTSTQAAGAANSNITTRNLYLYDANKSGSDRWEFIAQIPFPTSASASNVNGCASAYQTPGMPLAYSGSGAAATRTVLAFNCMHGTPDGKFLTFQTAGKLTADDTDNAVDVYAYEQDADRLVRVTAPAVGQSSYTCVSSGAVQCNGDLGWAPAGGGGGMMALTPDIWRHANVTEDHSVIFESTLAFVPEDTNGRSDVYRWHSGNYELMSPGSTADDSYFSGNTLGGRDVFIFTSAPLDQAREIDPADFDVYDVRLGGGFSSDPIIDPCDVMADKCQKEVAPVSGGSPQQSSSDSEGNVVAPPPTVITPRIEVSKLTASSARALARTGRTTVQVRVVGSGTLTVSGVARLDGANRTVARTSGAVDYENVAVVNRTIRLSAAARSALKRRGSLKLAVTVTLTGASAQRQTLTIKRNVSSSRTGARKTTTSRTRG
jgi:hypothetical protein